METLRMCGHVPDGRAWPSRAAAAGRRGAVRCDHGRQQVVHRHAELAVAAVGAAAVACLCHGVVMPPHQVVRRVVAWQALLAIDREKNNKKRE